MDTLYSPQSRIAAGRVVLASSALFAVWLDPTEPAKFARVAYSLLVAWESPEALDPLVASPMAEGSFLCPEAADPPTVLFRAAAGLARWPRNLRERVSALNGTVALDTSRSGARLVNLLPLWEGAG